MITGTVFNIQKFCTSDGPGIRTVVFLKGCPLHCLWCHNAESQSYKPELLYMLDKCVYCGRCTSVCDRHVHTVKDGVHTLDRDACTACGRCADSCFADALEVKGREMTVDEVLAEVMKDKLFYDNSGGGITLSGGEPTAQLDFILALLKESKARGLHTCIETCGFTSKAGIHAVAEYVDLFLYDIKHTDSELHKKYTGVGFERILENLRIIDDMGKSTVLRCPIIPDVNDTDTHFKGIAAIANGLKNVLRIELEPYHDLGRSKYKQIGKNDSAHEFCTPDDAAVDAWLRNICALTEIEVKRA